VVIDITVAGDEGVEPSPTVLETKRWYFVQFGIVLKSA